MVRSNWKEVVLTTRAAPTVFILARIRCMFGGTVFPYAFAGITVVPLRGGDRREDLPFERKTPGGCSYSSYRRPPGFRGCESKRGDDRCAKGNKHCSYVFVDSTQITGGRNTHGDKSAEPRPPQRTLNDPLGKPKVSLAIAGCGPPACLPV